MQRFGGRLLLAVFVLALGACGIPAPDPALWQTPTSDCPSLPFAEGPDPADIFVMSTSLPDCRAQGMSFSTYRSHRGAVFAKAKLTGPDDSPAMTSITRHVEEKDRWLAAIRSAVSAEGGSAGKLVIYIHGYNNSYDEALETAEKVRRSYRYTVPTVLLSWPSRANGQGYVFDEASIGWAQQYNSRIITDLAEVATDITIVSHSMGARALVQGVLDLDARRPDLARHVKRLVMASPDMDRHRVLRDGGEIDSLLAFGRPEGGAGDRRDIVVYTSGDDRPIRLSRMAHGYARLGSTECKYSVDYQDRDVPKPQSDDCHATRQRDNFWIIDTSRSPGPDSDVWRHSDVFDSCTGRADLRAFLMGYHDRPWRQRLDWEKRPDWHETPAWKDRVGWRLVDDPTLERDGVCVEWVPD